MKYDNFQAFEKHAKNAAPDHFAEVYLILSKDPYERKEAESVLTTLIKQGKKNAQVKILDGEGVKLEELMSELNTLPFLSDCLVVVLQNTDKLKAGDKELVIKYFLKPNRTVIFILCAEVIAANTKFYKQAEKAGVVLDLRGQSKFHSQKQYVSDWMRQKAQSAGKEISPRTCEVVMQQIGQDRSRLDQELEKLICYLGERTEITPEDVAAICLKVSQENIWKLGESILSGNAANAIQTLRSLVIEGIEFIPLLRQIRTQLQREFQICSILLSGGGPAQVQALFPYLKGVILNKHIQMAKCYGAQRFKRALISIDTAEFESKNSAVSPDLLAEKLILKLTL